MFLHPGILKTKQHGACPDAMRHNDLATASFLSMVFSIFGDDVIF